VDPFSHLHVHTDYSILDGHTTLPELAEEVARLGQPAVAMTDHGSLAGIRKHYDTCNSVGVKPIIGCEMYVAPKQHTDKEAIRWGLPEQRSEDVSGQGAYTHCTLLATTDEGIRNLFRLHAAAYTDGFYRKPRIDTDLLGRHASGIIATTGCAGGAVATRIRLGQYDEAVETAATLRDIFPSSLYVEIMEHNNPIDDVINPSLIQIAKTLKLPLLATNDTHYTTAKDAYAHDALLCVQTGQRINSDNRAFKFEGSGYHIRSHREMATLFKEIPDAVSNTLAVVERVEEYREIFDQPLRMPVFPIDGDVTLYLEQLCVDRLDELLLWWDTTYRTRLKYELDTISALGFEHYFLVMADIVKEARKRGRVGPGRGSVGGSLVAFAAGITDLDPIAHDLLFERFLNPERVSLPDIDVDFQDTIRDEMVEWTAARYGRECVAQLGTYGTIGAKSAIHDAARVLGYSRRSGELLTYRLPPMKFGRAPSLAEGDWTNLDTVEREILSVARSLEGRTRNMGVHAAGVVVSPEPLTEIVPLYRPGGKGGLVTEYDMDDVEKSGLIKMDFLGLKNLTVIDDTMKHLFDNSSFDVLSADPEDLDDERTFNLLRSGNTLGVFQLDSPGMQQLLRSIKPDSFSDISAVLALYRPGPMGVNAHSGYAKRKNGKERVSYPHSELEKPLRTVLASTYGFVVYQEQVLEILRICCGYTYATAEGIFNSMRKKDTVKMLKSKPDFTERMLSNGYSQQCVTALWDVLVPFSDYSFNRSHTTGYGVVSYWTAYLKTNYPTEYMAALLSSEKDPKKLPQYVGEVERMRIPILPPDVNDSDASWTPTNDGIRYGLISIKNFGDKAYAALLKKRPYKSLDDFFTRADRYVLGAKPLGALVQSGAMDSLCPHRADLYLNHETLSERALSDRSLARKGQQPLYSTGYTVQPSTVDDYELRQQWERELLGTVLSLQPITVEAKRWLDENEFYYIRELVQKNPGRTQLLLKLGYATINVGYIDWTEKVRIMMESLLK
jgi:DNA polymerase-3 subunit alpha